MGRNLTSIALYSGGLDSILAIKLIIDQGCQVEALEFYTPFFCSKDDMFLREIYPQVRLHRIDITNKFWQILIAPKYGYGKNMNPCLDCKILMLSEARAFMERMGADFVFTGEVLGQRPMSQRKDTLIFSERKSGLEGKLLRPLSAKLLSPTLVENEGLINREGLLGLSGRSRKRQIAMARSMNLKEFPTPGGGCLLTDPFYTLRLRSLIDLGFLDIHKTKWIRVGRHFNLGSGIWLVVGRNHIENELIANLADKNEILFKTVLIPGPEAVMIGNPSEKTIHLAASIVAYYSDCMNNGKVAVVLKKAEDIKGQIIINPITKNDLERLRI